MTNVPFWIRSKPLVAQCKINKLALIGENQFQKSPSWYIFGTANVWTLTFLWPIWLACIFQSTKLMWKWCIIDWMQSLNGVHLSLLWHHSPLALHSVHAQRRDSNKLTRWGSERLQVGAGITTGRVKMLYEQQQQQQWWGGVLEPYACSCQG